MDFIILILVIVTFGLVGLRFFNEPKFNQLKEFIKNKYMR